MKLAKSMLVCGANALLFAGARGATPSHAVTVEDYFSLATVGDVQLSPDGKYVAYTQTRWEPPRESMNTDIWVAEAGGGRNWRVTFDPVSDGEICWAPDSQHLYFASARSRAGEIDPPYHGKRQVWVTGLHGGAPLAITRLADGIQDFELSADGRYVYYTHAAEVDAAPFAQLRKKYTDLQYGAGPTKASELARLDLETWRSETLCAPERYIRYFAVAPDQQHVALITAPDDRLITHEGQSAVEVLNVASRELVRLSDTRWRDEAPSPYGWLENPAWSHDSTQLAFTVAFDGYPTEVFVATIGGSAPAIEKLSRPGEAYIDGHLRWGADQSLYALATLDGATTVCRLNAGDLSGRAAGPVRALPRDVKLTSYDIAPAQDVLVVAGALPGQFAALGRAPARPTAESPEFAPIANANPHTESWQLPQIQRVNWEAPDGVQVHGVLELPTDWKAGDAPLPLVVELHGGPTASTQVALDFRIYGRTLLPAHGYAVFSPNYRGSTGYGDKFLTDLIGRENEIEVKDILSGVDALIARGVADADRLGVMGWSNGGYLTNCVIAADPRFKAASSGAGVIDQLMQWGVEDTPGHVINYMRGLPWDRPAAYQAASPIFALKHIRTATLIHVGEDDARVPAIHAQTLFRALHDYNQIPAQLIIYPGQGHGLMTYTYRKAKMEWDLAWFEKYLKGADPDDSEAGK